MNKNRNLIRPAVILLTTLCLSVGCSHRQQINNHTVEHVKVDTVAPLQASLSAPSCSLNVDFCYLQPTEAASAADDSVMQVINTTLVTQLLGEDYASLSAPEAVNQFKTNYLNDYRLDMQELYAADLKNQVSEDELPSWYNRAYDLKTQLIDGREGILCSSTSIYEFAGGAHPNSWEIWMNFRLSDGHLLTTDEVFIPTLQEEVSNRLLDALILWAQKELDNKNIKTISDLQNEGLLLTSQLYIPENFLLLPEEVRFVYNRYDIAPYALGAIELSLPYKEIEEFME